MKVLEINHCNKKFGDNEVLKDISLSVSEGQVVSVIGPSGSGKSTLLRCATLLETMDGGDLVYLGEYAAKADAEGKAVYSDKYQKEFRIGIPEFQPVPALFCDAEYNRAADFDRETPERRSVSGSARTSGKNGAF